LEVCFTQKANRIRINEDIRVREVRVIGDDGEQLGVLQTSDALNRAREAGLDLVEVAATSQPPVCKIMDFGKHKYELAKRARDAKKKQHHFGVKEVKYRPKIEKHDYDFKTKRALRFLERGDKVKITIQFRGREMAHPEFGRKICDKVATDVSEVGSIEQMPKREGRTMVMFLQPLKKTVVTKPKPAEASPPKEVKPVEKPVAKPATEA
jgi:translation initiation factor IF-3